MVLRLRRVLRVRVLVLMRLVLGLSLLVGVRSVLHGGRGGVDGDKVDLDGAVVLIVVRGMRRRAVGGKSRAVGVVRMVLVRRWGVVVGGARDVLHWCFLTVVGLRLRWHAGAVGVDVLKARWGAWRAGGVARSRVGRAVWRVGLRWGIVVRMLWIGGRAIVLVVCSVRMPRISTFLVSWLRRCVGGAGVSRSASGVTLPIIVLAAP